MAAGMKKKSSDIEVLGSVQDLLQPRPKNPKEKSPRTLMLNHKDFERFQDICRDGGTRPSVLIERWIKTFLAETDKENSRV